MAELRSDVVLHSGGTEESDIPRNYQPLPQPEPVDVLDEERKGEEGAEASENVVVLR